MSLFFRRFRIGSFKRDERAVSAVEFALLAPMMIGLYLGGVEQDYNGERESRDDLSGLRGPAG